MAYLSGRAYFLSKKVGKAISDYGMLDDGDRVAVAVSGGKDSLALLRIMQERRKFVPIKYEIIAVHVDLGYGGVNPARLERYLRGIGVEFHIERSDALRSGDRGKINCFWCSWNRRKALFEAADRLGCAKVALGHHKDDIVQTILLNFFFHGEISAMCPKQELFGGKLTLIRPLAYAEEKEIIAFAAAYKIPAQKCRCPHSGKTNRALVGRFIAQAERVCPDVKTNIFRSVKRIKREYLP